MSDSNTYDESNIVALKPQEHVRLRPGMYIGGIDKNALHHLFHELFDYSIDGALEGHCNKIWITLRQNAELSVRDNGRGMSIRFSDFGKRILEHVMTYGRRQGIGYYVAGGLHGFGVGVVNALSSECTVEVATDGHWWRQTYRAGIPQTEVVQVRPLENGESTGTLITIRPDFTILEPNDFDYEILVDRAREAAYLIPNLTIALRDERYDPAREDEYQFANGLSDYVTHLNQPHSIVHSPYTACSEWTIHLKNDVVYTTRIEIVIQYSDTMDSKVIGYVNTLKTTSGAHTDNLISILLNVINERTIHSKFEPFSKAEIIAGLTAVVNVWHPCPLFEDKTNAKFISADIRGIIVATIEAALPKYPYEFDALIQKLLANREALKS
jgi:DNA gyrase subunit B